jgi:glucosyl-3-phosphoglycerate synthase
MDTTVLAALRRHHHSEFPAARLAEAKEGRTISVCLPARNEAATIGSIVETIRRELVERVPLVDEILVVDDHSTDRTSSVAADAGARVVSAATILPEHGAGHGKGEVLWKSVYASVGDLIAWCDADIRDFGSRFVTGIVGPLVVDPSVAFVKGYYHRPGATADGGGRVTELVARPLLSMLFPHLCRVIQPLSGEYGGRRDVLERLPFVQGYGVDIGLLIDLARIVPLDSVVQVDLDVRHHRNRPLDELSPQAMAVAQTILHKARPDLIGPAATLVRPHHAPTEVEVGERPPLVELSAYLSRASRSPG